MGATAAAVSRTTFGAEVLNLMVDVAVTVGLAAVKRLEMLPVALTSSAAQAFAARVTPARRTHTQPANSIVLRSCGSCLGALKETLKGALKGIAEPDQKSTQQGSRSTMAVVLLACTAGHLLTLLSDTSCHPLCRCNMLCYTSCNFVKQQILHMSVGDLPS